VPNIRQVAYTKPDPALPKIGARLLTRRALDLTRFEMARLLGTDVRCGGLRSRPPAEQALKLSPYGIPLDWIYQGRTTDLHPHIHAKFASSQSEGAEGNSVGRQREAG
jgi:hypothetical protein